MSNERGNNAIIGRKTVTDRCYACKEEIHSALRASKIIKSSNKMWCYGCWPNADAAAALYGPEAAAIHGRCLAAKHETEDSAKEAGQ